MKQSKLMEIVADIAYIFGEHRYFSGDSRYDVETIKYLALEFKKQKHDWENEDYILKVTDFAMENMKRLRKENKDYRY